MLCWDCAQVIEQQAYVEGERDGEARAVAREGM